MTERDWIGQKLVTFVEPKALFVSDTVNSDVKSVTLHFSYHISTYHPKRIEAYLKKKLNNSKDGLIRAQILNTINEIRIISNTYGNGSNVVLIYGCSKYYGIIINISDGLSMLNNEIQFRKVIDTI